MQLLYLDKSRVNLLNLPTRVGRHAGVSDSLYNTLSSRARSGGLALFHLTSVLGLHRSLQVEPPFSPALKQLRPTH